MTEQSTPPEQLAPLGYYDAAEREFLVNGSATSLEDASRRAAEYDATHVRVQLEPGDKLGTTYITHDAVMQHMLVERQTTENFIETGDTIDLDETPEEYAERHKMKIVPSK